MCAALDAKVEAFRGRSLAGERCASLWLDATYLKVREAGRVVDRGAGGDRGGRLGSAGCCARSSAARGGRHLPPTRVSVIRLVGMILAEADDEWQDGRRYSRPDTMALTDTEQREVGPALLIAS